MKILKMILGILLLFSMVPCFTGCKNNENNIGFKLDYDEQSGETFRTYYRYKFVNEGNGKVLSAYDLGSETVVLNDNGESVINIELWRIEKDNKGEYYIKNAQLNMRLGIKVFSAYSSRAVLLPPQEDVSWKIEKNGNGYKIMQTESRVLEAKNNSVNVSQKSDKPEQRWKIYEIQEFEELAAYKILTHDGKALEGSRDNNISVESYDANLSQQWFINRGANSLFSIYNIGCCYNLEYENGLSLRAITHEIPEWNIKKTGFNTYQIIHYNTGKILSYDNGLRLIDDTGEKTPDNQFKIMLVYYKYPVPSARESKYRKIRIVIGKMRFVEQAGKLGSYKKLFK